MAKSARRKQPTRHTLTSLSQSMTRAAAASLDAAETAAAAGAIIASRTQRIQAALCAPDWRSDPELARMVSEKVAAGIDSNMATGRALPAFHRALMRWAQDQYRFGIGLALDLFGAPSAATAAAANMRYLEASTARASAAGAELAGHWLRLMIQAAAPIRRAVRANAKRLERK